MKDEERFREATQHADAARAHFLDTLAQARTRFAPARLRSDMEQGAVRGLHQARARARTTARRHPVAIGILASTLLAWLLRRPLRALFRRSYVGSRDRLRLYLEERRVRMQSDDRPRIRLWHNLVRHFRRDEK